METVKTLSLKLLNLGISNDMPYLLKKRIQFTNGICTFLCLFMVFLFAVGYIITGSWPLAFTFLAYWVIPITMFILNSYGKHAYSRWLFIPATFLYFTISSSVTLITFFKSGIEPGILNIYLFRHYSTPALLGLFISINRKEEPKAFTSALLISLFFIATYFIALNSLGISLEDFTKVGIGIPLNEFFLWTSFMISVSEILFLMSINSKFERTFLSQNAELASQKEEISTINEQLKGQKEEITMQRDVLERVHSNLMASINYAQRIQDALLPTRELLKEWLPPHFILFKPRDVVSGDFYWAASRDSKIFWICGDCTGHGVPGAFMTVVGMNLLHQIIMEEAENDPSTILLRLNRRLEQSLRHEESTGKKVADGMDLALVVIDTHTRTFQFAGAKRPLYFFPKGGELEKVKGSKFAIGGGLAQGKIFDTHTFTFASGDRIFLFSDGYPDQYGGADNRKFMLKKFRELICDIQAHPIEEQSTILEEKLEAWRGKTRQTDDILVMGMEF